MDKLPETYKAALDAPAEEMQHVMLHERTFPCVLAKHGACDSVLFYPSASLETLVDARYLRAPGMPTALVCVTHAGDTVAVTVDAHDAAVLVWAPEDATDPAVRADVERVHAEHFEHARNRLDGGARRSADSCCWRLLQ